MTKSRLEAFSDGVIAILITIMVLELKVPAGDDLDALSPMWPVLSSYVLSFIYLAIYWNNHHHMLHMTTRINGKILWANLHLLFWLSLVPFCTSWVGQHFRAAVPTSLYGVVLLFCSTAYVILEQTIIADQGEHSPLREAVGKERKGKISTVMYASGVGLAFVRPWISDALYIAVALMWLVPDRRIEKQVRA